MHGLAVSVPEYGETDVIVVGGGPAGVAAAIAAKRRGSQVTLVEQSCMLGGMATSANVAVWMPVGRVTGFFREICEWIVPDWLRRYPNGVDAPPPQFSPHVFRHLLNHLLSQEGVTVLLGCTYVHVAADGDRVVGVVVQTRGGLKVVRGEIVIDATGDGRVAIDAGAGHRSGRTTDGWLQPMSLVFTMQDTGKPVKAVLPTGCRRYESLDDLPEQGFMSWQHDDEGTLLVFLTGTEANACDVDQLSCAERELVRQMFSGVHYLQTHGYETYALAHVPAMSGIQETNQIEGLYRLTGRDVLTGRRFDDVIAQTNYFIDAEEPVVDGKLNLKTIDTYDIPYRVLVPRGVERVLVAGRAVSATHVAVTSLQVQPTCMAMGQAAGVAASISIEAGCALADVDVGLLQQGLREQGVQFG